MEVTMKKSWLTNRCKNLYIAGKGFGCVCTRPIKAGDTVAEWAGEILSINDLNRVAELRKRNCVQIGWDEFLTPIEVVAADYINHSCAPTCGISGDRNLVAIRDILIGEEITYDYAMTDSVQYDNFHCRCSSKGCRRLVTGSDWRIADLQQAFNGFFSDYLQCAVDSVRPLWHEERKVS
jgi:hypothetical protein